MKVVKCSDDTYAQIADHADQRHVSISRAVSELVSGRVATPEYFEQMALPLEAVREVVREELQRNLRDVVGTVTEGCVECRSKDRDLADREHRIQELEAQIEEDKRVQDFGFFAEFVVHAKRARIAQKRIIRR